MENLRLKLPNKDTVTPYAPTEIPRDKYARVVEGRNRFLKISIGCVILFTVASAAPQIIMSRAVKKMYRQYCHGKVLDLSPKLYDETDVALYELSRTVRVEYLVEQRVVDDGHYKIDESLPEAEKEERRRAMTLDFMLRNDHHWVGSPVNFGVVERKETHQPGFRQYDCVVIRDEMMNHKAPEARKLFDSAAEYLAQDGKLLVMDYGRSKHTTLNRAMTWFNKATNSSMCLTHDYKEWIRESMLYEVVTEKECMLGFYHTMVLQRRQAATPKEQTIS